MTPFFERLEKRARQVDSLLCVGLDPHPQDLPQQSAAHALEFCLRLIEATRDSAAAFKPNMAFFEALGPDGINALKEVIAAAGPEIPLILDAKRGDIASTADAYASAVFDVLGADAVTLSPYLGRDSLEPFISRPEHGAFILCKTSNPGSTDLQDLTVQAAKGGYAVRLYEHLAEMAVTWNQQNNLGLVVGATHPPALERVRRRAPGLWILAPGVGAQGGDLAASLKAGLREDGMGLLIPVSRGIARAADPRRAAERLRQEINQARAESFKLGPAAPVSILDGERARLADRLLAAGCVKFGMFTLKSGLQSPVYIDLRRLTADPGLLAEVADAYLPTLRRLHFDRLAALPYAALPIGTAVSLEGGWPLVYPRKETKKYGTKASIEGVFSSGERAVIIDDLTTTGSSKFEAIEKLTQAGLQVQDVVVLIDRQSGASEALAQARLRLHAVFTLTDLVSYWEKTAQIAAEQAARTREFIRRTGPN